MNLNALRENFSPTDLFRLLKFKYEFKKSHPNFFDPFGTCIFCGPQGSGKTLSAVNYVYSLKEKYPYSIVVSNVLLTDYPFNAHLVKGKLLDDATHSLISSEAILDGTFENVVVEYTGLDCLKYINNGEYGVIYLIDELHLELNSLESKNIDIDVMVEISQQRKQRKHIVGTSQIFMRLAKPLREQVFDVVLCHEFFNLIQFNKLIDGTSAHEESGKLVANVRKRVMYTLSPRYFNRYDTYAKMKRYNKEWNGRVREPVTFFDVSTKKE